MAHSSSFDATKFIDILHREVKDAAQKRYGGTSNVALGKAFQFWCIDNTSTELSDDDVELARSRCEAGGAGDENIDGAWIDKSKKTFFLMQSKYSPPNANVYSEDFTVESFGAQAAEELDLGFQKIFTLFEHPDARVPKKLLEVIKLYREAVTDKLRIELVVTISGYPRKTLLEKVEQMNVTFRGDTKYSKHHVSVYDIGELNQIYSDKWAKLPEDVYLAVSKSSELENLDKSIYAVSATVLAKELVRIREECGYGIYHSNFRFVVTGGKGVARPKIEKTLGDPAERQNFWRYNNGITISCRSVVPVNEAKDKYKIEGLQVVNGLQTIETLWETKERNWLTDDVRLLVRVIPIGSESTGKSRSLEEHIAEYSNSQTPITPRDLRANDPVQQEIERIASEVYDLKYIRKIGQMPGQSGRPSGKDRVDNEDAAQAALSFWFGQSWEAKSKLKVLFELSSSAAEGFYDKIFNDSTTPEYILFPALLWDFQYKFIRSTKDKARKGIYRGTDLLAMAIFGEEFRDINGLPYKPTTSERVTTALKSAVFDLKNIRLQGTEGESKKCWKPIFDALCTIVDKRRRAEAKRQGVGLEDISPRNIYVNLKYSDPELKKQIKRELNVRALRKTIADVIPCRAK